METQTFRIHIGGKDAGLVSVLKGHNIEPDKCEVLPQIHSNIFDSSTWGLLEFSWKKIEDGVGFNLRLENHIRGLIGERICGRTLDIRLVN